MKSASTRLILLAFLLFAVLSATGGIVYQWNRSARPLEFYGTEGAHRIRKAPTVHIVRLERFVEDSAAAPAELTEDVLTLEGQTWRMTDRREITRARGLVNIRYALLDRGTYDWDAANDGAPSWAYALEFVEPAGTTRLALSFENPRVTADGQRVVSIAPSAGPIQAFIDEQFPAGQSPADEGRAD